ncbi:bis-aminopropyl spermidine synthase family protein [Thermobifida alba]|uniref:Bis-aminopropyl spermidine synthase family protein n=1 Tax=Thermobifida alba TaxID=53522 RepID=A0ABY4KX50_THEAE|nr:bis-aminopropyl spermidine synthase family protein [Thermobifida alba]UPT20017.1 bis-aminopropyl spermidine synthase family protein [Thermobifida alba]
MSDDTAAPHALLAGQGVHAVRGHLVLGALADGRWWTTRDLVRATAVAHRVVAETLAAVEAELDRDGDRVRLRDPARYASLAARPGLADPVGHLVDAHPEAEAELRRLVAEAPAPRADLDHVSATARTALRRALFLTTRFTTHRARLLCVGDHDLTSLALTLVDPDAEATVVDIDERMLDYIDTAAARLGRKVRCYFADLRFGLPPAVRGSADLVFTDPPYTPEGVELFVRRGLEGSADPRTTRVLLAYGASETTPALAARVQRRLTRLHLAIEALWPDFNRYLGAEAIGAASDLYVLRATARTPLGRAEETTARIYSQGAHARESAATLTAETARRVWADTPPEACVGDWPGTLPAEVRRVPLDTWLSTPAPARSAAVNLTGGAEALTERVILASPASDLRVVVDSHAPQVRDAAGQEALRRVVGSRRPLRFLRGLPDARHTVIQVGAAARPPDETADPAAWLAHRLRHRAHGSVASVLRESLVQLAARTGRPVNKKWARTHVAAALPWLAGHTLLDLPLHRFAALDDALRRLAAALPPPTGDTGPGAHQPGPPRSHRPPGR